MARGRRRLPRAVRPDHFGARRLDEALVAVLVDGFDLDRSKRAQFVVVAEFGRVGVPRTSPREEAARRDGACAQARPRVRVGHVLRAWDAAGPDPRDDPRLLTPGGARPLQQRLALVPARVRRSALDDVGRFFTSAASSRSSAADPDLAAALLPVQPTGAPGRRRVLAQSRDSDRGMGSFRKLSSAPADGGISALNA